MPLSDRVPPSAVVPPVDFSWLKPVPGVEPLIWMSSVPPVCENAPVAVSTPVPGGSPGDTVPEVLVIDPVTVPVPSRVPPVSVAEEPSVPSTCRVPPLIAVEVESTVPPLVTVPAVRVSAPLLSRVAPLATVVVPPEIVSGPLSSVSPLTSEVVPPVRVRPLVPNPKSPAMGTTPAALNVASLSARSDAVSKVIVPVEVTVGEPEAAKFGPLIVVAALEIEPPSRSGVEVVPSIAKVPAVIAIVEPTVASPEVTSPQLKALSTVSS